MNIVYLSNDFSKVVLPENCEKFPEAGLNGKQIDDYVKNLKINPKVIATCSLYLLREIQLQRVEARFINDNTESDDVDGIGSIEILDRELEQSDRYMNQEMGL